MAQTKSKSQVLQEELDRINAGAFLRDGQTIQSGDAAFEVASSRQNVQTEGQSGLMANDVFEMPKTLDELKKVIFTQTFSAEQEQPSVGIAVVVERKGQFVPVRVYSTAFSRGVRRVKAGAPAGAEEYEEGFTYPSGAPAKDFRDAPGSIVDAFVALLGATIKVSRVDTVEAEVIKRGAVRDPATGRFPTDRGKRKLPAYEYVVKPIGSSDDSSVNEAEQAEAEQAEAGNKKGSKK